MKKNPIWHNHHISIFCIQFFLRIYCLKEGYRYYIICISMRIIINWYWYEIFFSDKLWANEKLVLNSPKLSILAYVFFINKIFISQKIFYGWRKRWFSMIWCYQIRNKFYLEARLDYAFRPNQKDLFYKIHRKFSSLHKDFR